MELKASDICKVLAVETRLNIIKLLKTKGPLGAKNISENLGVTPAAISQHLKILSQIGLVRSERNGFFIPYSVDEAVLKQCRQLLSEVCLCGCNETGIINQQWHEANLETLQKYEKDLQQEIDAVRERIRELAKKGAETR